MSEQPLQQIEYVRPDGTLTDAGWLLLQSYLDRIEALETTIASHTATIADHEARITALEP